MEENKLLSNTIDQLTDKSKFISVSVNPKSKLHQLLMKLKILPTERVFELRPIVVGNMYRMSAKVIQIPDNIMEHGVLNALMTGSYEHIDKLIYIIAVGIQNNSEEPNERLLNLIRNEFTAKDVKAAFNAIMFQLNLSDFIQSITLIKGINILDKVSPSNKGELIAPQD